MQHHAGASRTIVPAILDDVEDTLAHQHAATHHPVHRAAVDDFLVAARKIARAVAQRRTLSRPLGLQIAQMLDIAHTHGELGEMQHGPATRSPIQHSANMAAVPATRHLCRTSACYFGIWLLGVVFAMPTSSSVISAGMSANS